MKDSSQRSQAVSFHPMALVPLYLLAWTVATIWTVVVDVGIRNVLLASPRPRLPP